MKNDRDKTEILEAIQAADDAIVYLHNAQNSLRKSRNWGIADLMGGGILSTMRKHDHMAEVERQLENARRAIRKLSKEIRDVEYITGISIQIGDFLRFADYFFDGFIADWVVQSKIRETQAQVEEALQKVEYVKRQLEGVM